MWRSEMLKYIKILFINKIGTVKEEYIRLEPCNTHYAVPLLFKRGKKKKKKNQICYMYIPWREIYGKADACFIFCYSPENRW